MIELAVGFIAAVFIIWFFSYLDDCYYTDKFSYWVNAVLLLFFCIVGAYLCKLVGGGVLWILSWVV